MSAGTVKWFDQRKGFGFITAQDGQDLFVHFTAINPQVRPQLKPGQAVRFEIATGEKGPKAVNLELDDDAPAVPADPGEAGQVQ